MAFEILWITLNQFEIVCNSLAAVWTNKMKGAAADIAALPRVMLAGACAPQTSQHFAPKKIICTNKNTLHQNKNTLQCKPTEFSPELSFAMITQISWNPNRSSPYIIQKKSALYKTGCALREETQRSFGHFPHGSGGGVKKLAIALFNGIDTFLNFPSNLF